MDTTATKTRHSMSWLIADGLPLLFLVPLLACFLPVGLARVATGREPWHFQEQAPAGEELEDIVRSLSPFPWSVRESPGEDLPFFPFAFVFSRPPGRIIDHHYLSDQMYNSFPRHYTHYVLLDDNSIWKWPDPLDSFKRQALWYLGAVYAFVTFITPLIFFVFMSLIAPLLPLRLQDWLATNEYFRFHTLPRRALLCLLWLVFGAVLTAVICRPFFTVFS